MYYPRPHSLVHIPDRSFWLLLVSLMIISLLLPIVFQAVSFTKSTPGPATPVIAPPSEQLPLTFVPNVGQTNPVVQFQARGMGGTIFFTSEEVVLSLPTSDRPSAFDVREHFGTTNQHSSQWAVKSADKRPVPTVVRLQFVGSNPFLTLKGEEELPGIVNHFIGNNPEQWRTNLPTYASVVYDGLYDGIDLHYEGQAGHLKGTYIVAPGADPSQIRWHYTGADHVQVDESTGDLILTLPLQTTLREQAPIAWQTIDGTQVPVDVYYIVTNTGIGFTLGHYDLRYPLTIDPTLTYSRSFGGSSDDYSRSIAVDNAGNVYITGYTRSNDFPTVQPLQSTNGSNELEENWDVFVTKLNANGTVALYSTYIGGSDWDYGHDIAVDSTGMAYITGRTDSGNFPLVNPLYMDLEPGINAFVSKLNADGTALVYSTYIGGNGTDIGEGIAVDNAGNAYITGSTMSENFPIVNPVQGSCEKSPYPGECDWTDAFVVKLSSNGQSIIYSTFIGGYGWESGQDIVVDSDGYAYVTGYTHSSDFPIVNALQNTYGGCHGTFTWQCADAFIVKLSPEGNRFVYSTYFGGSDGDEANGIAVDASGNAYITGRTISADFRVTSSVISNQFNDTECPFHNGSLPCSEAFVTKIAADGKTLFYSTFLGGKDKEYGKGIAVDNAGNAYVTGDTYSDDFPIVRGLPNTSFAIFDGFVAKLNVDGSALLYSTYLSNNTSVGEASDIVVDQLGSAYVTGIISNIPGYWNVLVVKINNDGDDAEIPSGQPPSAAHSTIIVPMDTAPATGTPTSVTVRLLDAMGVPVVGRSVMIFSSRASDIITQSRELTDLNGEVSGAIASYDIGPTQIGAVVLEDNVTLDARATLNFGGSSITPNEELLAALADRGQLQTIQRMVTESATQGDALLAKIPEDIGKLAIDAIVGMIKIASASQPYTTPEKLYGANPGLSQGGLESLKRFVMRYEQSEHLFSYAIRHGSQGTTKYMTEEILANGLMYHVTQGTADYALDKAKTWSLDRIGEQWVKGSTLTTKANILNRDINNTINSLAVSRQSLEQGIPTMSEAAQQAHARAMVSRHLANLGLIQNTQQTERLMKNLADSREQDEKTTDNDVAFWLKFGANTLASVVFPGTGSVVVGSATTSFETYFNGRKLNASVTGYASASSVVAGGVPLASMVFQNINLGYEQIAKGLPANPASAQVEAVDHISVGNQCYVGLKWCEKRSYTRITIINTGNERSLFIGSSRYGYDSKPLGLFWSYLPQVTQDSIFLDPGQQGVLTLRYLNGAVGGSPDAGSSLFMTIAGCNRTGCFEVQNGPLKFQDFWHPQRLNETQAPASLATAVPAADDVPTVENPISMFIVPNPDTQNYELILLVTNPLTTSVQASVTLQIPSGVRVLSDEVAIHNQQLTWNGTILDRNTRLIRAVLMYDGPLNIPMDLPPATLQVVMQDGRTSETLTSNAVRTPALPPIELTTDVTSIQQGQDTAVTITTTNLLTQPLSGMLEARLVGTDEEVVLGDTFDLVLAPRQSGSFTLTIPNTLPVGQYRLELWLTVHDAKRLERSELVDIYKLGRAMSGNMSVYLPMIHR